MSYVLRRKDGDKATADLLRMINIIAPGSVPQSKYLLLKAVHARAVEAEKHHYCPVCKGYLGPPGNISKCENCETEPDPESYPFFLVLPIKQQLQRILVQPDLKWMPATPTGPDISDITDGEEHVRLCSDFSSDDLSLIWNTDGISLKSRLTIFNPYSAKYSNWTQPYANETC